MAKSSSQHLDELYERDSGVCWICHRVISREIATRDHLIPRSKGGPDNPRNYAIACAPCNNARGSKNMLSGESVQEIIFNIQRGKCHSCNEQKGFASLRRVSSYVGSRKILRGFCVNCPTHIPKQHDPNVTDAIEARWVKKGQRIRFNIGSIHSGQVFSIKEDDGIMRIVFEGSKKAYPVPGGIRVELLKTASV